MTHATTDALPLRSHDTSSIPPGWSGNSLAWRFLLLAHDPFRQFQACGAGEKFIEKLRGENP